MTRLPNFENAIVATNKLTAYLLSLEHSVGKHKAMFFIEFGFSLTEYELLKEALHCHAATRPIVKTTKSEHGDKYVVECEIETPDGRNPCINSVWIIESGTDTPRLITAYPG